MEKIVANVRNQLGDTGIVEVRETYRGDEVYDDSDASPTDGLRSEQKHYDVFLEGHSEECLRIAEGEAE